MNLRKLAKTFFEMRCFRIEFYKQWFLLIAKRFYMKSKEKEFHKLT